MAPGQTFLDRRRAWIAALVFGAALAPRFLILTEHNVPMLLALRYATGPLVAGCAFAGYRAWRPLRVRERISLVVNLFGLAGLGLLLASGAIAMANAVLPPQRDYVLDGVVARKAETTGRLRSRVVWVRTAAGEVAIDVTPGDYAAARVGAVFHQLRWKGPLGFSYVWR